MATAQLTERQQQIVDLQKEGKKAPEIAKILGITPNGVYQQIRRMRDAKSGASTAKAAKPSSSTGNAPTSVENITGTIKQARAVTPLQSIRNRRDEITAEIKSVQAEQDAAARALTKATDAATKIQERYEAELSNLMAAEAALKGEAPPAKVPATPKPGKSAAASTPRPKAADAKKSGKSPAKSNGTAPAVVGEQPVVEPAIAEANQAKVAAQPTPPEPAAA